VTSGETRDEALQRAPDAVLTIFDAFMKDRRDIPVPSLTAGDVIDASHGTASDPPHRG
jgi:predicted RNase H-like HicB family nuclease